MIYLVTVFSLLIVLLLALDIYDVLQDKKRNKMFKQGISDWKKQDDED